MADISQEAFDLIVREEVDDEAYYAKCCTHYEWPGGESGPTVGIGYDLGYVDTDECCRDWLDIISDDQIASLLLGVGLHGDSARRFVGAHKLDITITWGQALKQFTEREVPKWVARVRAALPKSNYLNGNQLGALVSLCYNRGIDFDNPYPRFEEMRAIKDCLKSGQISKIPHEILKMQRLWAEGSDLWRRRAHEAALFTKGLHPQEKTP